MCESYYSLLGVVRTRSIGLKIIIEVSYKDEDVYTGQYKEEKKWHQIGMYDTVDEVNDIILALCKEETKRNV
jgi:hypothetical protein